MWKFQLDLRRAGARLGNHALKPSDVAQIIFLLNDDLLLDVLGRRAGPGRAHGDRAHIEIGDHLLGNAINGREAEQTQNQNKKPSR